MNSSLKDTLTDAAKNAAGGAQAIVAKGMKLKFAGSVTKLAVVIAKDGCKMYNDEDPERRYVIISASDSLDLISHFMTSTDEMFELCVYVFALVSIFSEPDQFDLALGDPEFSEFLNQ